MIYVVIKYREGLEVEADNFGITDHGVLFFEKDGKKVAAFYRGGWEKVVRKSDIPTGPKP